MPQNEERLIAVCGLDCTDCDIRRVPTDADAAQRIVGWFKDMGWLKEDEGVTEILARRMYCKGCRGDRSLHWSADCWILHCCVDEHGLQHCSECAELPCDRLREWAAGNDSYTQALQRLGELRAAQDPCSVSE